MIECHLLKKNTIINKIVPEFMDTLYTTIISNLKKQFSASKLKTD